MLCAGLQQRIIRNLGDVVSFPAQNREIALKRVYEFSARLAALVKEAEAGGLPIETQIAVFEDVLDVLRAETA
jgi:hypothetical protein